MKPRYFELARKLAFKSNHHTHKMGCIIVRGSNVVGMGYNKLKTHTRSPHLYRSTHAEFDAILDCNRRELSGADLYVYRETKDGSPAMSKPCRYCESLIRLSGIARVFYSCINGFEMLELD